MSRMSKRPAITMMARAASRHLGKRKLSNYIQLPLTRDSLLQMHHDTALLPTMNTINVSRNRGKNLWNALGMPEHIDPCVPSNGLNAGMNFVMLEHGLESIS